MYIYSCVDAWRPQLLQKMYLTVKLQFTFFYFFLTFSLYVKIRSYSPGSVNTKPEDTNHLGEK